MSIQKLIVNVHRLNPTELRGRSSGQYTRSIENSYPARSYYVHVAVIRQRDVHGLLRGLPWNRRQRRRAGGQRAENASRGPDAVEQEQRRQISGYESHVRYSRNG